MCACTSCDLFPPNSNAHPTRARIRQADQTEAGDTARMSRAEFAQVFSFLDADNNQLIDAAEVERVKPLIVAAFKEIIGPQITLHKQQPERKSSWWWPAFD